MVLYGTKCMVKRNDRPTALNGWHFYLRCFYICASLSFPLSHHILRFSCCNCCFISPTIEPHWMANQREGSTSLGTMTPRHFVHRIGGTIYRKPVSSIIKCGCFLPIFPLTIINQYLDVSCETFCWHPPLSRGCWVLPPRRLRPVYFYGNLFLGKSTGESHFLYNYFKACTKLFADGFCDPSESNRFATSWQSSYWSRSRHHQRSCQCMDPVSPHISAGVFLLPILINCLGKGSVWWLNSKKVFCSCLVFSTSRACMKPLPEKYTKHFFGWMMPYIVTSDPSSMCHE